MPIVASNGWKRTISVLLLLGLSGLASSSFAGVCTDAVKQYCSDARPEGREAVTACLENHRSELSGECAEQLDMMAARAEKGGEKGKGAVCADDVRQYCSDVRSEGREAMVACLGTHKSELSSECAEEMDKMAARAERGSEKGKGGVCADAVRQFCSDVRSGGHEAIAACLETHKSELSGECAEQVGEMAAQQ